MARRSETFLYLGRAGDTHAWTHFAPPGAEPAETSVMCREAFHALLDNGMVKPQEAHFVFSVAGGRLFPICVEHSSRAPEAAVELPGGDFVAAYREYLLTPRAASDGAFLLVGPAEQRGPYSVYELSGAEAAPIWDDARAFARAKPAAMELTAMDLTSIISSRRLAPQKTKRKTRARAAD